MLSFFAPSKQRSAQKYLAYTYFLDPWLKINAPYAFAGNFLDFALFLVDFPS
jgi:hypothetical protein